MKLLALILVILFILSLGGFSYQNAQVGMQPAQIALSALILSIPLASLYFAIFLLAAAALQKRSQGRIGSRLARWIHATPRTAGLLVIVFVALFALDVFEEGQGIWVTLGALLLHALPAILMGIVLAIAWRRPAVGFWTFLLGALFFLRVLLGNPWQNLGTLLLFSFPMAVIALLFWVDWKWLGSAQPAPGAP